MGKINSFEDLKVWQKARDLTNLVYDLVANFPKEEKFNLVDQLKRATLSVPANIAEGFSRYHLKESILFYRNARGSLSETKSHFYIALDRKYITKEIFSDCIKRIDEVGKMLNGLINSTEIFRA